MSKYYGFFAQESGEVLALFADHMGGDLFMPAVPHFVREVYIGLPSYAEMARSHEEELLQRAAGLIRIMREDQEKFKPGVRMSVEMWLEEWQTLKKEAGGE